MKLNFGVRLPVSGPLSSAANIIAIAEAADKLGFDAVTTHDHVSTSYNERYHNSGGTAELVDEQDREGLPVTNFFETMTTLAMVAGKTERVRLIPCAAVLPWRQPVLFAKQAVTLHEMSGGRFVCCVCIGNMRTDFNAMSVDYSNRGKIMDEYLEVLNLIFSSSKATSFKGNFTTFPSSEFFPKPSKKLPVWIGGQFNSRAFSRLAKFGNGFLADVSGAEDLANGMPKLKEYLKKNKSDISDLEIGIQTFMCLMKDGGEAEIRSKKTISNFYFEAEYDKPDPKNPDRTIREAMIESSLRGALVGSSAQVVRRIEEYAQNGTKFFDIRLVNRSLDDVVQMMTLFANDVMTTFS